MNFKKIRNSVCRNEQKYGSTYQAYNIILKCKVSSSILRLDWNEKKNLSKYDA